MKLYGRRHGRHTDCPVAEHNKVRKVNGKKNVFEGKYSTLTSVISTAAVFLLRCCSELVRKKGIGRRLTTQMKDER